MAATNPAPTSATADRAPRPKAFPEVIALEESRDAEFVVPPAPVKPAPTVPAEPGNAGGEVQPQIDQRSREGVAEEAGQMESARLEAERQESARQESARQESARQESARQESARQESARQDAARQEAARHEAARQDATRQEAARVEAARGEAAREQDARRDAVRRAMGRQLDEEAARREANQAASRPSPSSSPLRRARLFGRSDPNAELILYAEAWSRRIQFNMTFDMVREAAKQPCIFPNHEYESCW